MASLDAKQPREKALKDSADYIAQKQQKNKRRVASKPVSHFQRGKHLRVRRYTSPTETFIRHFRKKKNIQQTQSKNITVTIYESKKIFTERYMTSIKKININK